MNKNLAKQMSVESKISVGELRKMISAAKKYGGMSKVNSQFPLSQVCAIYESALAGRPDEEVPKGMTYDVYKEHDKPSKDSLIICNILRDCA